MRPVTPTADPQAASARLSLARAGNIGAGLSRDLASVALLDLNIERPLAYTSPQRDVYLLTVHCDDALSCRAEQDPESPQMVVSVLRSRPTKFQVSGRGRMIIALITPLGFLRAFGMPMRGMTDRRIDLGELVGRASATALRDRILLAPDHTKADALALWIEDRIAARRHIESSAERVALAAMQTLGRPQLPVEALARAVGLQRRQLERDFRYWLGLSPGAYAKLIRFQRAATDIHTGRGLADVTYAQGFADQPHLSRVMRRMCWATPGQISLLGLDRRHQQLREAFGQRVLVMGPRD